MQHRRAGIFLLIVALLNFVAAMGMTPPWDTVTIVFAAFAAIAGVLLIVRSVASVTNASARD
jgi:hypothetical protein